MNEPATGWNAAERAALERLRATGPPADLEDAVVAALAGRSLIRGGPAAARPSPPRSPSVPARRAWAWGVLALAAALAAFLAGISISDRGAGRTRASSEAAPAGTVERYLLLLYEDAAYRAPATPEEQAARVAEYGSWVADLRERGIDIRGEELAPGAESARLDGRERGVREAVGAPASELGILSGYFLVAVADADAAVGIARTTPHLRHGGTVVIRRVVEH